MIGIRTIYKVAANQAFTTNVVLATVGLTSPLAANQKQKFRCWIPISVGATGGVQFKAVLPAGATILSTSVVNNTVAPSQTAAVQTTSVAITNALANAGNHWLYFEGYVENGAVGGSIDIQVCQNTSDANTLTVLKGGTMETTILN